MGGGSGAIFMLKWNGAFIGALAIASASAAAQTAPGDWVLAQWQGGAFYYPATVKSANANMVTIVYDDGTVETRPRNQVKAYSWKIGSRIQCKWSDGKWYGARITAMGSDNVSLSITYDQDGSTDATTTANCRST